MAPGAASPSQSPLSGAASEHARDPEARRKRALHNPVIVTVTFPGDPLEGYLQTFDDAIGQTPWWTAANGKYGVGAATGGAHVVLTEPAPDADHGQRDPAVARGQGPRRHPARADGIGPVLRPLLPVVDDDHPRRRRRRRELQRLRRISLQHERDDSDQHQGEHRLRRHASLRRRAGGAHGFGEPRVRRGGDDPHPGSSLAYVLTTDGAWNPAGGETADMCEFVSGVRRATTTLPASGRTRTPRSAGSRAFPFRRNPANLPYYNAGIVNEELDAEPGRYRDHRRRLLLVRQAAEPDHPRGPALLQCPRVRVRIRRSATTARSSR